MYLLKVLQFIEPCSDHSLSRISRIKDWNPSIKCMHNAPLATVRCSGLSINFPRWPIAVHFSVWHQYEKLCIRRQVMLPGGRWWSALNVTNRILWSIQNLTGGQRRDGRTGLMWVLRLVVPDSEQPAWGTCRLNYNKPDRTNTFKSLETSFSNTMPANDGR